MKVTVSCYLEVVPTYIHMKNPEIGTLICASTRSCVMLCQPLLAVYLEESTI